MALDVGWAVPLITVGILVLILLIFFHKRSQSEWIKGKVTSVAIDSINDGLNLVTLEGNHVYKGMFERMWVNPDGSKVVILPGQRYNFKVSKHSNKSGLPMILQVKKL